MELSTGGQSLPRQSSVKTTSDRHGQGWSDPGNPSVVILLGDSSAVSAWQLKLPRARSTLVLYVVWGHLLCDVVLHLFAVLLELDKQVALICFCNSNSVVNTEPISLSTRVKYPHQSVYLDKESYGYKAMHCQFWNIPIHPHKWLLFYPGRIPGEVFKGKEDSCHLTVSRISLHHAKKVWDNSVHCFRGTW